MGKLYIYKNAKAGTSKSPRTWSFATKTDNIEAQLKVSFDFSYREELKINEMVKVNESLDCSELIELICLFLGMKAVDFDYTGYYYLDNYFAPEREKTDLVGLILSQIEYFLKKRASFISPDLAADLMLSCAASLGDENKGTVDFFFKLGERKYLLPVEVNKMSPESAAEQCLLAMHLMHQKNGNNQMV